MSTENAVRALAGTFVLASVTLGYFVHPAFLLFTGFVGLNLIQSSVTGFCPAEMIFRRLGLKPAGAR
jgi:hypothetical protein